MAPVFSLRLRVGTFLDPFIGDPGAVTFPKAEFNTKATVLRWSKRLCTDLVILLGMKHWVLMRLATTETMRPVGFSFSFVFVFRDSPPPVDSTFPTEFPHFWDRTECFYCVNRCYGRLEGETPGKWEQFPGGSFRDDEGSSYNSWWPDAPHH